MLTPKEIARYSRHLILPEVGVEGQLRLKGSSALVIGAGGLGSPLGLYLAAAGVGRIGLVDFDVVDESNLQRQVLHGTADVGRPKLDSARERLQDLNPHVAVEAHTAALTSANALEIIGRYDVVIDGTDNFPTRYLVNDACVFLGKPNVYGSIFRFEGQASVFWTERGPCYRCLYPDPPPAGEVPNCAEGGVLGVLPGVIGTIQATEALKFLLSKGELLVGRLLLFDALAMEFREMTFRKDPHCPVCGPNPTIRTLIDYEAFCGVKPPEREPSFETTPVELKARLDRGEPIVLVDVRNPPEWALGCIEGARRIPLPELPSRVHELPKDQPLVVYCHVGARSAAATEFLRSHGFTHVQNLAGGIRRWALDVDPRLPAV